MKNNDRSADLAIITFTIQYETNEHWVKDQMIKLKVLTWLRSQRYICYLIQYFDLPGIISSRLFSVFDKNKNEFLDLNEFTEGMTTIFTQNFDKLIHFIFNFYDFDKDGYVIRDDIRTVLAYIPLNTGKYANPNFKYEK